MSAPDAFALFYAALTVSLPTFGWVVLGVVLQRLGLLPPSLSEKLSRLAFNVGLPLMLFANAAQVDYSRLGSARYLLAGVLATLSMLVLSWIYSRWRNHPRALRGIFVQAAFRSNLAIVGVALTFSAYGSRGPVLAALPIALMTALYNILAVWVLNATLGSNTSLYRVLLDIVRNPLVIGISAGVGLSLSGLPIPVVLRPMGSALSTFFLPLVLVCIGGSMNLSRLYRAGALTWEASVWRLCVAPLIGVLLALAIGVRDEPLGVLFLLLASPVAASSHVMVVAARGDGTLAANIVVLTTLLSMVTITVGFFLLSVFSLVGQLR
ncbi:MAG TPA: AEC family transporter [Halioglobus sp.]